MVRVFLHVIEVVQDWRYDEAEMRMFEREVQANCEWNDPHNWADAPVEVVRWWSERRKRNTGDVRPERQPGHEFDAKDWPPERP